MGVETTVATASVATPLRYIKNITFREIMDIKYSIIIFDTPNKMNWDIET